MTRPLAAAVAAGDLRGFARVTIAGMLTRLGTAEAIAAEICGSYSPGFGLPPHGYTIGGGYAHARAGAPIPLPRGRIAVYIGDEVALYSIRELVAEVRAGATQATLL